MNSLPFAKLLDLLAINHIPSERCNIFAPWLLKLSHILGVLQFLWVRVSMQLSWMTQYDSVPFPGSQGYCGIVPNEHTGLVVSLNIRQELKC